MRALQGIAHCRTRGSDLHAKPGHQRVRRQQPRKHWSTRPWSCGATQARRLARNWVTPCPAQVPARQGQPPVLASTHALESLHSAWGTLDLTRNRQRRTAEDLNNGCYRTSRSAGSSETLNDAHTVWAGRGRQAEGESSSAQDLGLTKRGRRRAQHGTLLKPSDMLISRASLFYSSTFPAHAGFPSTREGQLTFTFTCLTRWASSDASPL